MNIEFEVKHIIRSNRNRPKDIHNHIKLFSIFTLKQISYAVKFGGSNTNDVYRHLVLQFKGMRNEY